MVWGWCEIGVRFRYIYAHAGAAVVVMCADLVRCDLVQQPMGPFVVGSSGIRCVLLVVGSLVGPLGVGMA